MAQRRARHAGDQVVGGDLRHLLARPARCAANVRQDDDVRRRQQRIFRWQRSSSILGPHVCHLNAHECALNSRER